MLSILQGGVDRRVRINAVDSNGTFNINDTSHDTLKLQRVDGSLLYGALALSFLMTDKTGILQINNVELLKLVHFKRLCF